MIVFRGEVSSPLQTMRKSHLRKVVVNPSPTTQNAQPFPLRGSGSYVLYVHAFVATPLIIYVHEVDLYVPLITLLVLLPSRF